MGFSARPLAGLSCAEFPIIGSSPTNAAGGDAMVLVVFISFVALLGLAFVPVLTR
jgi:hypothetical protein